MSVCSSATHLRNNYSRLIIGRSLIYECVLQGPIGILIMWSSMHSTSITMKWMLQLTHILFINPAHLLSESCSILRNNLYHLPEANVCLHEVINLPTNRIKWIFTNESYQPVSYMQIIIDRYIWEWFMFHSKSVIHHLRKHQGYAPMHKTIPRINCYLKWKNNP